MNKFLVAFMLVFAVVACDRECVCPVPVDAAPDVVQSDVVPVPADVTATVPADSTVVTSVPPLTPLTPTVSEVK